MAAVLLAYLDAFVSFLASHWLDLGLLSLGLLALFLQFLQIVIGVRFARAPLNVGLALFSMAAVTAGFGLGGYGIGAMLTKAGWNQAGHIWSFYSLIVFLVGAGLLLLGLFLALIGGLLILFGKRTVFLGAPLLLLGFGGLCRMLSDPEVLGSYLPDTWPFWVMGIGAVVLIGLVITVLLTGSWYQWPAIVAVVMFVFGLGGFATGATQAAMEQAGRTGATLEILHPDWLLLLGFLPVFVLLAARSLELLNRRQVGVITVLLLLTTTVVGVCRYSYAGEKVALVLAIIMGVLTLVVAGFFVIDLGAMVGALVMAPARPLATLRAGAVLWRGPLAFARAVRNVEIWRPWFTLLLRCSLVLFLALALAEPRMRQQTRNMTVIFVVDRSLSIPQEYNGTTDVRAARVLRLINESVEHHAARKEGDQVGLIVFARDAQLIRAPGEVSRLNERDLPAARDPNFTNIETALKQALASFPPGTGKRIVLISDGNENRGDAFKAAAEARAQEVQIDVMPLAAGEKNEDEVVVERIDVPTQSQRATNVPLRVFLRSFNPNRVEGKLIVKRVIPGDPLNVTLPVDGKGGIIGLRVRQVPRSKGMEIVGIEPKDEQYRKAYDKLKVGQRILAIDGDPVEDEAVFVAMVIKKEGAVVRRQAGEPIILTLESSTDQPVGDSPRTIILRKGLHAEEFALKLEDADSAYSYEAEFKPTAVLDARGKPLPGPVLPRDRPQNNKATAHVQARGQRRVLVIESRDPDKENTVLHPELEKALKKGAQADNQKYRADFKSVNWLNSFNDLEVLKNTLGTYDCIVLANVPAGAISEGRQEALRAATQDLGCGLVMIGGGNGYGAGGWAGTPVEKALPVDCEVKSLEVEGKGGLVLVMHACEIAEGNLWEKRIAKLSLDRLSPTDKFGIVEFGFQGCQMAVNLQEAGKEDNRRVIYGLIDKMSPGDMPSFDDSLTLARDKLAAEQDLLTRHVIVISDGDPLLTKPDLLKDFKQRKITISTVTVGGHGAGASPHGNGNDAESLMLQIAKETGGRAYVVKNPQQLPAIYTKESRLVSQSFIHNKEFTPNLLIVGGPTKEMKNPLPKLGGFVRTSAKDSPLVEVVIKTSRIADQEFPVLATWQYGLGKAVAWTSDAGDIIKQQDVLQENGWMRPWIAEGLYDKLWSQTIEWAMRPTDSGKLQMRTEAKDGKIIITVDAIDDQRQPDTKLRLTGVISAPGGEVNRQKLTFVQGNNGQYVAEAKAEDPGSYFIEVRSVRLIKVKDKDGVEREVEESIDRVPGGVTLPHSPEFSDVNTNVDFLEKLRAETGGVTYTDSDAGVDEALKNDTVFRTVTKPVFSLLPLWWVLVVLCAVGLFVEIAVRRVAFNPDEVKLAAEQTWARVLGRTVPEAHDLTRQTFQQTRPADIDRRRAARRFDASADHGGLAPPSADDTRPPEPPLPSGPSGPSGPSSPPPQGGGSGATPADPDAGLDFAERLARAKRRALGGRDPENPPKSDRPDR